MLASRDNFPLLEALLAEQQRLDTPVARFAREHDAGNNDRVGASAPRLLPLTAPAPGEQYAFEVDLDSCTGCKSCVAACHSLNGLDDDETWRDVGLLVDGDRRQPFSQTVTTACHHCEDPACLNGCPVLAYEKDPVTGIVRHLDDQCIGCGYCVLKCPYDVPKYSKRLGIVRKCDMCQGRLAHGEAPACAQACPTQAIRIVVVSKVQAHASAAPTARQAAASTGATAMPPPIRRRGRAVEGFLPGAPDPAYTLPTTRYISKRGLPVNVGPADAVTLRPQPAHWPLVALLLFMPMAVGCGIADKVLPLPTPLLAILSWFAGVTGLAFSVAHLGQPRRAWRVFLGLRRSWLSREAVTFGGWLPLASADTAYRLHWLPLPIGVAHALAVTTATCGVTGVFCSAMLYADTRRAFWRLRLSAPRFLGTAMVLGLASALICVSATPSRRAAHFALALGATVVGKLLFESEALEPLKGDRDIPTPALQSARLLVGPLRYINEWRVGFAMVGGILLPVVIATAGSGEWLAWLAFVLVAIGEFLERSLFFRAVDAPKMPGCAP